jgi:hypothetical protein
VSFVRVVSVRGRSARAAACSGKTKRPPGAPDGLVESSPGSKRYVVETGVRRYRPGLRSVVSIAGIGEVGDHCPAGTVHTWSVEGRAKPFACAMRMAWLA